MCSYLIFQSRVLELLASTVMESQLRDDDGGDVKQSDPCLLSRNISNTTSIAMEQLTEGGVNRNEEAILPFRLRQQARLVGARFFWRVFGREGPQVLSDKLKTNCAAFTGLIPGSWY